MIVKPKALWKFLKSLGIPNKTVTSYFNAIEERNTFIHDVQSPKFLKNLFSNLADFLLVKPPNPPDKYNLQSVIRDFSNFTISDDFCLNNTSEEKPWK